MITPFFPNREAEVLGLSHLAISFLWIGALVKGSGDGFKLAAALFGLKYLPDPVTLLWVGLTIVVPGCISFALSARRFRAFHAWTVAALSLLLVACYTVPVVMSALDWRLQHNIDVLIRAAVFVLVALLSFRTLRYARKTIRSHYAQPAVPPDGPASGGASLAGARRR